MPILDDLFGHARRTTALEQAAGILGWDRETMMPPDGAGQRAEQSAAMSAAIHARHSDPKVGEWLGELDASTLAPTEARSVELIARKYQRATRVSEDLASHLARTTSRAQGIWVEARRADQFAEFKPMLAEIVALKREEAACLVRDGGTLYDALLWDFEPGFTSANLDPIFAKLRASLSDLRGRIAGSGRDVPVLDGHFPHSAQMALARKIAPVLGYDLKGGRIDLAVHPFCAGSGGDVRITTRVDERDPLNCLYSSMHEMGHAIYKQNIPRDLALDPLGGDDAMGPHESQSRLIENQIGRSRSFATYLWPMLTETFGDFGLGGPDAWYRAVNRVETGYIRTEADEVHYNLHIILRYGLERDLIEGRLEVDDLEEAWNSQFLADFGLAVDRPSNGGCGTTRSGSSIASSP